MLVLLALSALSTVPGWAVPWVALLAARLMLTHPRHASPAGRRALRHDPALVALLHDIAHSDDGDARRVEAALSDIQARARRAGADAWS